LPINPDVWASCFPAFASTLGALERGRHDAYETTRLDAWSVGRVAIVGDAAHAMPPTLAQGACGAMMNALSLAVFVSEGSPIENALQRWEAQETRTDRHTQAPSRERDAQWDDAHRECARSAG
jgi:2-methyl-3-hydroxypyridine 5-carboxylic acid dioxygenase